MSAVRWVPIRYREFYDVPRMFIAEHAGVIYLFDCGFDDAADEYPECYRVYRLMPKIAATAGAGSWEDLAGAGTYVNEVPVKAVQFDATRRAAIHDAVFDLL